MAYHARAVSRLDDLAELLQSMIVGQGILPAGSVVVLVGGHPIAVGGATNFVKVMKL